MTQKNWLEEYQRNFLETRTISQLLTFLISLVSLLNLYNVLHAGYLVPEYVKDHAEYFWISVLFQVLTAFFFGGRFVLLFFSSKKTFWLSQLFWILSLTTLFAWCAYTNHSFYGFFYEHQQTLLKTKLSFPEGSITNLSLASEILDKLCSTYFFISPIRQFFMLIISVFKRW